jgi:G6PDH family F420-dependent oxidoreductase
MTTFGYTMMCEQAGPKELVRDVQRAEEAGFAFAVISDHYFPWLEAQGHSPYAWSVLGAAAQATSTIELMTYVTCPTMRYHPAIVAQKGATMQLLSDGRFTLNLGAGENLNEHVIGRGWPAIAVRHRMLAEAITVIRGLWNGGLFSFSGEFFDVESAKVWDLPEALPPIGVAVSGPQSCQIAGEYADVMVAIEPRPELGRAFDAAGGTGKPRIGQLAVCFNEDEHTAANLAYEQFRWFSGGWRVNAELIGPAAFAAASRAVRVEDVTSSIPCGPEVERYVDAVTRFVDAGFTHVALVQVGGDHQGGFLDWAEDRLLPALSHL